MRGCPRCGVPMTEAVHQFAVLDACPKCSGVFVDPGEGITALGHGNDVAHLAQSGLADLVGPSQLQCPSRHGKMTVYRVGGSDGPPLELDVCPSCAGVFFDAGEADVFKELAARAGEIVTASGARFSAPPMKVTHDAAVDEARQNRGRSALSEFWKSVVIDSAKAVRSSIATRRRRQFIP